MLDLWSFGALWEPKKAFWSFVPIETFAQDDEMYNIPKIQPIPPKPESHKVCAGSFIEAFSGQLKPKYNFSPLAQKNRIRPLPIKKECPK